MQSGRPDSKILTIIKSVIAKFLLLAATTVAFVSLRTQEMTVTADNTTFGLRAGVNFQNINGKDQAGNELNFSIITGYHAGLNAEIPIGSGFHIQPGVFI
ncbi:MAG: hypothetical protein ABR502_04815 [Chitinophagaceae bacterium]